MISNTKYTLPLGNNNTSDTSENKSTETTERPSADLTLEEKADLSLKKYMEFANACLTADDSFDAKSVKLTSRRGRTNAPRHTSPNFKKLNTEIESGANDSPATLSLPSPVPQTPIETVTGVVPTIPPNESPGMVKETSKLNPIVLGRNRKAKPLSRDNRSTSEIQTRQASASSSPKNKVGAIASPLGPLGGSLGSDSEKKPKRNKLQRFRQSLGKLAEIAEIVSDSGGSNSDSPMTPPHSGRRRVALEPGGLDSPQSPKRSPKLSPLGFRNASPKSPKSQRLTLAAQRFLSSLSSSSTTDADKRLQELIELAPKGLGLHDWVKKLVEALSSGTREQLVRACDCLALKCDSTPDADDPKKLLLSALQTHLRELPTKKAAQTFLDKVFLSHDTDEQAALLLEVVEHAHAEFGTQAWVKKAVEAFDSIGKPQDLVKVCKLHMDLVKPTSIDPQQKSDLEKLLFALQTHLRTPDPMRRAELLSRIALNAKEKHGNRFGKEYKSTLDQIDQYLDAYIEDWRGNANQPFLREDNETTRKLWRFWDTQESVVALRDDLVDLLVVAAAQAAKKLEGLPLNGPKVQADLLTEGQMKIMLAELTPLFTKLFSAQTARALSPDTRKLMQLIQDKVDAKEINASAAILFFLRLIAPMFLTVNAEAVKYDSQGLLQREIAFMKFAGQVIQKLIDDPLNPLENLGLTPECKDVVSDWLKDFNVESFINAALARN